MESLWEGEGSEDRRRGIKDQLEVQEQEVRAMNKQLERRGHREISNSCQRQLRWREGERTRGRQGAEQTGCLWRGPQTWAVEQRRARGGEESSKFGSVIARECSCS